MNQKRVDPFADSLNNLDQGQMTAAGVLEAKQRQKQHRAGVRAVSKTITGPEGKGMRQRINSRQTIQGHIQGHT